jgi:hypothetical protein
MPPEPLKKLTRAVPELLVDRDALPVNADASGRRLFAQPLVGKLRPLLAVPEEKEYPGARPDHSLLKKNGKRGRWQRADLSSQLLDVTSMRHGQLRAGACVLSYGAGRLYYDRIRQVR